MRSPARYRSPVVDQAAGVGGDVDAELVRRARELVQVGIVDLKRVHVVHEEADRFPRPVLVAVPKQPFDPFQVGQQVCPRHLVVVGEHDDMWGARAEQPGKW